MENTFATDHARHMADLLSQAKEARDRISVHRMESLRKQAKDLLDQFRGGEVAAMQRFMSHHPNFPKDSVCLADAQSVVAREKGFASWPKMKASVAQCTLADEAQRARQRLAEDGKEQFASFFDEESLKRAIIKGVESYESLPGDVHFDGGLEFFRDYVKPMLLGIAETGVWPDNGMVETFYQLTDERGVTYEGLGACLEMRFPRARFPGFSLSILDVWYGRF